MADNVYEFVLSWIQRVCAYALAGALSADRHDALRHALVLSERLIVGAVSGKIDRGQLSAYSKMIPEAQVRDATPLPVARPASVPQVAHAHVRRASTGAMSVVKRINPILITQKPIRLQRDLSRVEMGGLKFHMLDATEFRLKQVLIDCRAVIARFDGEYTSEEIVRGLAAHHPHLRVATYGEQLAFAVLYVAQGVSIDVPNDMELVALGTKKVDRQTQRELPIYPVLRLSPQDGNEFDVAHPEKFDESYCFLLVIEKK